MYKRSIGFILFILFSPIFLYSQEITTEEYIDIYKGLAIREMHRSGVPASITLAQGILESASGNSYLAKSGNNHFGIKCHDWSGRRIFRDDDARDECFRKYKTAEESFIDHSNFLANRSRYAALFTYDTENYKAWAKGLKKAGYATAWDYAERLISLIERYNLFQYDRMANQTNSIDGSYTATNSNNIEPRIRYRNNIPYFIVKQGDTYRKIQKELNLSRRKIARYNDFGKYKPLQLGEPVYLKKKKARPPRRYSKHIATGRETMHDISQRYAISLSKLLKRNAMNSDITPYEGQLIILR